MAEPYFIKLPVFTYANTTCRNLTRRAKLANTLVNNPIQFYPYEVSSGMRADVLSYAYYNDSYMDWLIYLTNGIQDPYYDWYLSENDFASFIQKKYGSFEESQRRIKHYELNWPDDGVEITPVRYQSLAQELRKYYTPRFGQGSRVISYHRLQQDWVVNTNKILTINVNVITDNVFANGELVKFKDGGEFVGEAEIIVANTDYIIVKNITGNTSSNTASIGGLTSFANAELLDTNTLDEIISDVEFAFWTPVTVYEWERSKNESNKNIYLLDASQSMKVSENLRKAMSEKKR